MVKKVTIIAIAIPTIPNKFPCLEVYGDESPRRAKINNIPEIKYNNAAKFGDIFFFNFFSFFCTFATFSGLPKNLQKY